MPSLFDAVEMAPRDPILGLNEQFAADPNPAKVNLGVGVYYDENGKLPILRCVRAGEQMLIEAAKPRGYLPIDGIAAYDAATQALVFGAEHPARKAGRIATVQAVGGTGGLKVGADLLKRMRPALVGGDEHAARPLEDQAVFLAGEPDRRGVDDRLDLVDIVDDDAEEQRLVAVMQRIQRDVFFKVRRQRAQIGKHALDLRLHRQHAGRQQAAKAERVALRFREGGALVEQGIAQQRHAVSGVG